MVLVVIGTDSSVLIVVESLFSEDDLALADHGAVRVGGELEVFGADLLCIEDGLEEEGLFYFGVVGLEESVGELPSFVVTIRGEEPGVGVDEIGDEAFFVEFLETVLGALVES